MAGENVSRSSFGIARGRRGLAPDTRVAIAIYALLALLTVSVLVAVFLIIGVRKNSTQLVDQQLRYSTAIDEATLHAKGIANDERGFLISGRREFLSQHERRTAKARAAFAMALTQATGDDERQAVERAREGFERWVTALRVEFSRFQAGDRSGAVSSSLGKTRALRKTYESRLAAADALATGGIEAARHSVTATSSRSVTILLVYLVAALAIGFGIALWIVSSGPLARR
jgi:methyl-accepting chemotaxis protein